MASLYKNRGLAILAVLAMTLVAACGGSSGGSSSSTSSGTDTESGGVEFTNEYSSPSELSVGDLMYINFSDSGVANVDFTGVSSSAKFIMVLGSASEGGINSTLQLASGLAKTMEADVNKALSIQEDEESVDYTAEEILSAWLRASESELAATNNEKPPTPSVGSKAVVSNSISEGDEESFRVLSSLSSTSSYVEVTGRARCIKSEVILFVDTDLTDSYINNADIATLCSEYNRMAIEEQELIGETSDVDGDGKFHILMTKQINRLGQLGGGIITGYFWAGDLYIRTSSNPVSNYREIMYMMSPDPDGDYGYAVSRDFAMENLLPAVMPHELQHAISYNQHVFVHDGSSESNWLNEGLAHLMEDLMGYNKENPSRYALYLNSPNTKLMPSGQPNLLERGAAYLFLRYLYEQASSGTAFLKALVDTSDTGVANLENAFAGSSGFSQFHEFMARFTVAVSLTNDGITQDPRYTYQSRAVNSTTGNWNGVCLICDAEDGRGTELTGVSTSTYTGAQTTSVYASAARFFDIETVPSKITMNGTASASNFGVLIRKE